MSVFLQTNQVKNIPDALGPYTVNQAESGQMFSVAGAATADRINLIDLPALQAGLSYKFLMTASLSTDNRSWRIRSGAANIVGVAVSSDTTVAINPAGRTTITLTGANAPTILAGACIELNCNGTNWFAIITNPGVSAGLVYA